MSGRPSSPASLQLRGDKPIGLLARDAVMALIARNGLKAGDTQHLVLTGPKGEVVSETRIPALDRDKAQYLLYAGRKRPPAGWTPGTYTARYEVTRAGAAAIRRTFSLRL